MKYGLVCSTVFQGQVVQRGDLYDTREEAQDELEDMQAQRESSGMDADDDYSVVQIFQQQDGSWKDSFGIVVTVMEQEE